MVLADMVNLLQDVQLIAKEIRIGSVLNLLSDLAHNLLAPWHLALDATLLIGFLSWVYFLRRNKADR